MKKVKSIKQIFLFLILFSLIALPLLANAQVPTERGALITYLQEQIKLILQKIIELQKMLLALLTQETQEQVSVATSTPTSIIATSTPITGSISEPIVSSSPSPESTSSSSTSSVPLSEIEKFYQEISDIPFADKEGGLVLKSGVLPDGTKYTAATTDGYSYKDVVQERFIAVGFVKWRDYYYSLNLLIKYNIKPSEVNKKRLDLLSFCEVMSKPWNQEIRHYIDITSDNIYYKVFQGENMPIPLFQYLDFHPASQRYCSMDETQQNEWAVKLDALEAKYGHKISPDIAFMLWGWLSYSY